MVNVQNVSVGESAAIATSSLITSVSNPNGDSVTQYNFYDFGTDGSHFTVNGAIQPDDQWILVPASNLSSVQYVGGSSPGSETLAVSVFDGTTNSYSSYSTLTATTAAPSAALIATAASGDATAQLVQAMASFAPTGASLNPASAAASAAELVPQTVIAPPQHALS